VLARVIVDVVRDPTSHNLWPFEIVIAVLVGAAAAVAGALLGSLLLWAGRRENRKRES
jgi:ABC-type branched-subunit amino acid transport system permease subunit